MTHFYRIFVLIILLGFPLLSVTREYQSLVLGDFHYNEDYVDNISDKSDCQEDKKHVIYVSDKAPFGRYGCDSPASLVRSSLLKARRVVPNPEFIIILGDLVAHGVACQDRDNCKKEQKEKVKRVLSNVTHEITNKFPMTPVLYTLGNTDYFVHNEIPRPSEKSEYYTWLYETFIKNHPGNRALDTEANRRTFMDGGYYYYDVNSKVRILAINSIYFFKHNDKHNDPDTAKNQLKWIENQLEQINQENKKAVIFTHVPKSIDKSEQNAELWYREYRNTYESIIVKYKSSIDLTLTGHLHIARQNVNGELINTPYFDNSQSPFIDSICQIFANITYQQRVQKEYKYQLFDHSYTLRAVVPMDLNNPGISILYFDNDYRSKRFEEYTFDLRESINKTGNTDGDEYWSRLYDTETGLHLNDLSMQTLMDFHEKMLDNPHLILRYLMYMIGYPISFESLHYALDAFYMKRYLTKQEIGISFVCPYEDFENCVLGVKNENNLPKIYAD